VNIRRPDLRTLLAGLLESKSAGAAATFGEDNSIAAAYALDSVLKAVTDVGSISAFSAVPGFSVVIADDLI